MSYEIPVEDDADIVVCRVVWDGTLYDGVATVAPITGHSNTARNVANMILSRQDLKAYKFRSEGEKPTVNGWQGYEGTVAALRIILPALGLQIGHIGGDVPPFSRQRANGIAQNYEEGGIE